jgi:hypothetical protein
MSGAPCLATLLVPFAIASTSDPATTSVASADDLPVDPASLLLWNEAVGLVTTHESEIWPGYRLAEIPALVTHPKVGEILMRHPAPPAGFVRVTDANGLAAIPASLRAEPMWIRRGTTVFEIPQETSTSLGGVTTLVVSDRKALESADDAWCLGTVVHEGFHAWAGTRMKMAPSNEIDLADFPDLDPDVNAHLELEGRALEAAVRADAADAADETEEQLVLFLAERLRRRARVPANAIAWEDGNELNEGLATYVEWRAHDLWAKQGVGAPLAAALPKLADKKVFAAHGEQILLKLRNLARGTFNVNGSEFGPATVRYRGYDFGAALGRALDRVSGDWKAQVAKGATLTDLLRAALGAPADAELAERADGYEKDTGYAALVLAKQARVKDAAAERARRIAAVTSGQGTLVVLDFGELSKSGPLLPSSYTPFGILRVDDHRRMFTMVPVGFVIGTARIVTPEAPGVIVDEAARTLTTRVDRDAAALATALASSSASGHAFADAGLTIESDFVVAREGESAVRITLKPRETPPKRG